MAEVTGMHDDGGLGGDGKRRENTSELQSLTCDPGEGKV